MSKSRRTPERAAAVLDRASRMRDFKPGLFERNPFDRQIRTRNFTDRHPFYDGLDRSKLVSKGVQALSVAAIKTPQQFVSLAKVKDKLASGSSTAPAKVVKVGSAYFIDDGNHRLMRERALGNKIIAAHVFELPKPTGAAHAAAASNAKALAMVPKMAAGAGFAVGGAVLAFAAYKALTKSRSGTDGAYLDDGAKAKAGAEPAGGARSPAAQPERGSSGPIAVPGYTRADGVRVEGYTRQRAGI